MPSTWVIQLQGRSTGPTRGQVPLTAPFAVVSNWLDDPADPASLDAGSAGREGEASSEHDAQARPWALVPPRVAADGRTVLGVHLLADELHDRLRRAVRPGGQVRLGSQHFRVAAPVRRVAESGWGELERWPGNHAWQVRFVTPAAFRSRGRTSPWPDPVTVARGLSARWAGLRPQDKPPQPAPGSVWVSDVDGHSETVMLRGTVVSGFVGRIRFVCDGTPSDAAAFGSLIAFACYAGVGSHTTAGLGVIRQEATWVPGQGAIRSDRGAARTPEPACGQRRPELDPTSKTDPAKDVAEVVS